ncbi:hypothetical protein CT694_10290 [Bacillus wiedmannii bv. thuringiensis]|nr:hypothetical protein CT694_10290 [Bacillus wiedmannii bv. thuringiensis]
MFEFCKIKNSFNKIKFFIWLVLTLILLKAKLESLLKFKISFTILNFLYKISHLHKVNIKIHYFQKMETCSSLKILVKFPQLFDICQQRMKYRVIFITM